MPCVPTALASSLPLKAVRGGRGEAFSPAAELNTPELWARAGEVAKEIEKAEEKNSGVTCSPTSATQGAPSTQMWMPALRPWAHVFATQQRNTPAQVGMGRGCRKTWYGHCNEDFTDI